MNDEEVMALVCKVDGFFGECDALDKHEQMVEFLKSNIENDFSGLKQEVQDAYRRLKEEKEKVEN